ncbi:unnamed protein product [Zymoseptoria tritici ST99CH_1E4]|nr:unnamed protein product [Zymoseptoria tritici ST99CH_1E4]
MSVRTKAILYDHGVCWTIGLEYNKRRKEASVEVSKVLYCVLFSSGSRETHFFHTTSHPNNSTLDAAIMPSIKTLALVLLQSLVASSTPILQSRASSNDSTCGGSWSGPRLTLGEVMENWIKVWQGDHSDELVSRTMVPNVSLITDYRLEQNIPNEPTVMVRVDVHDSQALLKWMLDVGDGASFIYSLIFADPEGKKLVARWTLLSTLTADTPVKNKGDEVRMNGTDIIEVDDCSGRIAQILTSQDIFTYAYQMGIDVATTDLVSR